MVSFHDATEEEITEILKGYIDDEKHMELNNFPRIIEKAEVNEEWGDVRFQLSYFNIILNIDDLSFKDAEPGMPQVVLTD